MAASLLPALIGATLAGSVAILLILAARHIVRRLFGAGIAYGLWLAVPAAVIASLLPARPRGVIPLDPAQLRPIAETIVHTAADWAIAQAPALTPSGSAAWGSIILALWIGGAIACAAWLIAAQRRAVRRFGELSADHTSGYAVLRAATNDAGPAVIGSFKARLVIPYDFETRFSPAEQRLILAHERAHIDCADLWTNGLIAGVRCLNWFNPLVHLAATLTRLDQELARDAAVVANNPGERRIYAEALLKSQLAPAALPLGCFWPVQSSKLLKERIEMLASNKPGLVRCLLGATVATTIAAGTAYATWAAEPRQKLAGLAPSARVSATAPRPTMTATSYILPTPTEAQFAAMTASDPHGLPPNAERDAFGIYALHLQQDSGQRRSLTPAGYVVDDTQTVWLADGTVIPSIRAGAQNGVVAGLGRGPHGRYSPRFDGVAKYRVLGDAITVDEVLVIDGRAIALDNLKVAPGQTAVVQLAGGHILSLSPTLRPMTAGEQAVQRAIDTEDNSKGERQIKAVLAAAKPAASSER